MSCRFMNLVLVSWLMVGCGGPVPAEPATQWSVRFGPVIGEEPVVGRVQQGRRVWLATEDAHLLRIDVDGHRHARYAIQPLAAPERVWGLAGDGTTGLWTLVGFNTLAQLAPDGRIISRVPLAEPHSNVISGHDDLLYQLVTFEPGREAIQAGPPGDASRRPWGAMRVRPLALNRPQAALMNMVFCGPAGPLGVPCWFPDSAVVTLTNAAGHSADVALAGLGGTPPEDLLASTVPGRRPIMDVAQAPDGGLWVLSAGEVSDPALADRRGGWLLGRYHPDGRRESSTQLPEPARLVLGVTDASCLLLSWSGHVVEVRP